MLSQLLSRKVFLGCGREFGFVEYLVGRFTSWCDKFSDIENSSCFFFFNPANLKAEAEALYLFNSSRRDSESNSFSNDSQQELWITRNRRWWSYDWSFRRDTAIQFFTSDYRNCDGREVGISPGNETLWVAISSGISVSNFSQCTWRVRFSSYPLPPLLPPPPLFCFTKNSTRLFVKYLQCS